MAIVIPLAATTAMPKRYFLSQGYHSNHLALDMVGVGGQPVLAAESGVVFASSWDGDGWGIGGGNCILIDHYGEGGKRSKTVYAHLSSRGVSKGQYVLREQTIGWSGTTGNSSGNHLHFSVGVTETDPRLYYGYKWMDPRRFMRAHSFENGYNGNGDLITARAILNTFRVNASVNLRSGPYLSSSIKRTTTAAENTCYLSTVSGTYTLGSKYWQKVWHPKVGIAYVHRALGSFAS